MATRWDIRMINTALGAVAIGLLSCGPAMRAEDEAVDPWIPSAPDAQDVTVEHGDLARPESLALCESPGTFIAFENETERQVYDVLTAYKTGLTDTLERLTAKVIVSEARRYNLDPWLVVGTIRVESRFYNFAESNKGARGLMQVMPFVGEEVAADLGVHWNGADTLYNPIKNVKIGTAYLAILDQRFGGDLGKVLAAYNMGPNRVRQWLADGRDLPTGYSGLVREYRTLLGNIGTRTISGTDLRGRITMIEREVAKRNRVHPAVAEVRGSVADEMPSAAASEPSIEPILDDSLPIVDVVEADGGLAEALLREATEPAVVEPASIEPAFDVE